MDYKNIADSISWDIRFDTTDIRRGIRVCIYGLYSENGNIQEYSLSRNTDGTFKVHKLEEFTHIKDDQLFGIFSPELALKMYANLRQVALTVDPIGVANIENKGINDRLCRVEETLLIAQNIDLKELHERVIELERFINGGFYELQ